MVTAAQIAAARNEELQEGEEDIIDVLCRQKVIDRSELTAMLAQQYGMEMMDLEGYNIPDEVLNGLSGDIARHYNVVPVMRHGDALTIAMSDPSDMEKLDTLRYLIGGDVDAVVAPEKQIAAAVARYYPEDDEEEEAAARKAEDLDNAEVVLDISEEDRAALGDDESAPIIRLVTKLIIDAYKMKASDIHLEPMEKRYRIRYRVDGALREVEAPPKYLQANFTSRIKIMSGMDITEKRIPQDGRIQMSVGTHDIDLRVSAIPTIFGESIVMRILDKVCGCPQLISEGSPEAPVASKVFPRFHPVLMSFVSSKPVIEENSFCPSSFTAFSESKRNTGVKVSVVLEDEFPVSVFFGKLPNCPV